MSQPVSEIAKAGGWQRSQELPTFFQEREMSGWTEEGVAECRSVDYFHAGAAH